MGDQISEKSFDQKISISPPSARSPVMKRDTGKPVVVQGMLSPKREQGPRSPESVSSSATTDSAAKAAEFQHCFDITKNSASSSFQPPVPTPSRSRRVHEKSRAGCQICKSRRVKCDETYPECIKCLRRGVKCEYKVPLPKQHNQQTLMTAAPQSQLRSLNLSSPIPDDLHVHQLELMHHYDHHTSHTLLFGSDIWSRDIPILAFKFPFVLDALLAVSARHLYYLNSSSDLYARLADSHYKQALATLKKSTSDMDLNASLASSLFLIVYHWAISTTPEFVFHEDYMWLIDYVQKHISKLYSGGERGIFRSLIDLHHNTPPQPCLEFHDLIPLIDASSPSALSIYHHLIRTATMLTRAPSTFSLLGFASISLPSSLQSKPYSRLQPLYLCHYFAAVISVQSWWTTPAAKKYTTILLDSLEKDYGTSLTWPKQIRSRTEITASRSKVGSISHILIQDPPN